MKSVLQGTISEENASGGFSEVTAIDGSPHASTNYPSGELTSCAPLEGHASRQLADPCRQRDRIVAHE